MDVPSTPPHKIPGKAVGGLKSLPKWAWVAALGVGVLAVVYMQRRQNAALADAAANPQDSQDPNAPASDPTQAGTSDLGSTPVNYSGDLFGFGNQGNSGPALPTITLAKGSKYSVTNKGPVDKSRTKNVYRNPTTGGGPPHRPHPGIHHRPPGPVLTSPPPTNSVIQSA
jgi:hypothetical protein